MFSGHDRIALALVGAIALFGVWNALGFWHLTIDDAYIALRYARNLLEGNGLVYNPGERVEGFSDPLWVFIMAAGLLVGLPSLTGAKLVGFAAHAATIVGAYLLAHELVRPKDRAAAVAVAAGTGFLAVSLPATWWAGAGLETTFYTALLVLGFWRLVYELRHPEARPWSAGLAAAAVLTRPEAPLVVLGIVAGRAVPLLLERRFRDLGVWLAIFVVPGLLWLGFRLAYYGHPLPATFYKKGGSSGWASFVQYISAWLRLEAVFLVTGTLGLGAIAALRPRLAWPVLLGLAGQVFFVAYIGTDWMPNHRFTVPVLPLLAAGAGALAGLGAGRLPARVGWAAVAAIVLLVAVQGGRSVPRERYYTAYKGVLDSPRDPGMWFPRSLDQPWVGHAIVPIFAMERLPPDASLAYTDIGMTGWISDWTIIDISGLTDEVWAGATGADLARQAAYLGERRPDWIILKQQPLSIFKAISSSRWLVEEYELEQGPNNTLVARRRDAPRATDAQILANYEKALERQPRSQRFLARRMSWAMAVGTPEQKARACADIEEAFSDDTKLIERCHRLAGAKAVPRPEVSIQPLDPKLARFLPDGGRGRTLVNASGDAPVATTVVDNPFAQPGSKGIGLGWTTFPSRQDPRLYLEGDALRWDAGGADAEPIQACGGREPASRRIRVIGEWRTEGISPADGTDSTSGARIFLVVRDDKGRWLRPPGGGHKFWIIATGRGDQPWTPIDQTIELPEGTAEVRLCVEVSAGDGSAWFRGLDLQPPQDGVETALLQEP